MKTQPESELEQNLLARLVALGYERVIISDAAGLLNNLKNQLEKHNHVTLSEVEFERVLAHLDRGNVFDRAEKLRDKFHLPRDDGSSFYIEFFNTEEWCKNQYQVTNQLVAEGTYQNRYDVTLLINGLPLVQIELKRRGLELKEAFNQINRYQRHSFWATRGLFQYVQLFVISNGVNTKYYANNRDQSFKQTFYWADEKNELITQLDRFADTFLEKCHLSKMIAKYIVLQQSDKVMMVLRPYQFYAVEAIVDKVKVSRDNGYIWHTTGSGKTLTSFKAAQILTALPKVHKVVFVVDRADLDYQTTREFNAFKADCVDVTSNTASLVNQFADDTKLIVTTIQKLNNAISSTRHEKAMDDLKDKRIVFIFDECHRSQFGETHRKITGFFTRAQMFGFTGTPIFADNATGNLLGKRTTKDLFGECLHRYVITNAIKDENVLRFSVEYWGRLRRRDGSLIDDQVAAIDKKEFFENPDRIAMICDWVIQNHGRKTHNKDFTAIMAVGSVDALITYYDTLKAKRLAGEHDLRVVTIFTYGINEDDKDADGLIGEPELSLDNSTTENKHSREKLDEFIADYNALYGTKYSTKNDQFYGYYKDIAKRIKERDKKGFDDRNRVDILLVVNMYLTGFDAKKVNTLYVDKNLRYHGLIQAYSRTNRILSEVKSQGNIVCFRNLKKNTDEAIALFSNEDARETILLEPYEDYVGQFNEGVDILFEIAPTISAVDRLMSEDDQLKFIKAFRNLMRILNVLKSFSQFGFADLKLDEQRFEDYKSKYLDLYDKAKSGRDDGETVSIINDIDFELELIQRDEINVAYILRLLASLIAAEQSDDEGERAEAGKRRKSILDLLGSEAQLRSKRELIERFINEQMPKIQSADEVDGAFKEFWTEERRKALEDLCQEEGLKPDAAQALIAEYQFSGQTPLREQIVDALEVKPKILQRKTIIERVTDRIMSFIRTFEDNTGNV